MRLAKKADYPAVEKLYLKVISRLNEGVNYPLWTWGTHPDEKMIRDAIEQRELFVKEDAAGGIIAAGQLTLKTPLEPEGIVWKGNQHYGGIHLFCVDPDCSGQGLGGKCLRQLMEFSKESGCESVRLDVIEGNVPARNLYAKNGFETVGKCDLYIEKEGILHFEFMECIF